MKPIALMVCWLGFVSALSAIDPPRPITNLPANPPAACPDRWHRLIGEYGWDHQKLYVHERDGKLCLFMDWFVLEQLEEVGDGVFQCSAKGQIPHERLVFLFDRQGQVTDIVLTGDFFPRRVIPGVDGPTFRIKPERPVNVLITEARAAEPPKFQGEFATPDLVELSGLDATLKFDIRYATSDNFLGTPVYPIAKASLQRPAAEAMVRVHRSLEKDGLGLLIHDAYRPWYVTKVFWDATPVANKIFVADPMQGSRHNRGCAVDLTLYDRATGRAVEMPGGYDEFSDRSYPTYPGGTSLQRWYRDKLRQSMEAEGFTVYEAEWWHFDYRDWKKFPVLNVPLDQKKK